MTLEAAFEPPVFQLSPARSLRGQRTTEGRKQSGGPTARYLGYRRDTEATNAPRKTESRYDDWETNYVLNKEH